jgi:nitrite reductase/ring-hydroxylating ferredoxin subunit
MKQEHRVAKVGDINAEAGKHFRIGKLDIAVWHSGGNYYATDAICTHAWVTLTEGDIEDGCIECPLHGGRFDLLTGKAQGAPVFVDLNTYPVRIDGEDIVIETP